MMRFISNLFDVRSSNVAWPLSQVAFYTRSVVYGKSVDFSKGVAEPSESMIGAGAACLGEPGGGCGDTSHYRFLCRKSFCVIDELTFSHERVRRRTRVIIIHICCLRICICSYL